MKKLVLTILTMLSCATVNWALSAEDFPNHFSIKNTKEYQGSVRLTVNNHKIGSLTMSPYKSGTYEFYDAQNHQQAMLKLTKIQYLATVLNFDVYDSTHSLIAKLLIQKNSKGGPLFRFTIVALDGKTVLVTGVANLLGTMHTIYAENSWHELAVLKRPLFSWSRDSEVSITDKSGIVSRIDPNIFAAVLALYSSERNLSIDPDESPKVSSQFQALHAKIQQLVQARGLSPDVKVSDEQLKIAADTLNQRYQQMYDDSQLSEEEKINQFVEFGCGLIESNTFTIAEEQAMLAFLLSRLSV